MSDELLLNGKQYVSSKKAAEMTGYARDYIGQLSRGGQIDAERVGGLWYVSMESLQGYERNAEIAKTLSVVNTTGSKEVESALSFEGKEYISASRASKVTGYNQDYVGQLARGGKIPSRQIGNRWYVDREALVAHKADKDALLAAVQAESVGLRQREPSHVTAQKSFSEHTVSLPEITYSPESVDLLPRIQDKGDQVKYPVSNFSEIRVRDTDIRPISSPVTPEFKSTPVEVASKPQISLIRPVKRSKRPTIALTIGSLTIILVLAVGIFSFRSTGTFADLSSSLHTSQMSASAANTTSRLGDLIENIVSPELKYDRDK